jgi:excisionase family DNA binding protein
MLTERRPVSLVRVRSAADALDVREGTIRKWIAQQRIKAVRIGRAVRIPMDEIERLVREGR